MMWKQQPDRLFIFPLVLALTLAVVPLFWSCQEAGYSPKPSGFFRIDMPERGYETYRSDFCPCTFDYPTYGKVVQKTQFFDDAPDHPCWLNIEMPYFNSTLHISYMSLDTGAKREQVINDAYKYAFKHTIRADFIDETVIRDGDQYGVLFDIGGDVASSVQFFSTDSTDHYLRGSLYFNEHPNTDSLEPVIRFIRDDVVTLMRSVRCSG